MPLTLTEGDFAYVFDSSQWVADKYDTTPYYRRHFQKFVVGGDKDDKSDKGAKAVDIVAYKKDSRELWLIEAKDYRFHTRDPEKVLDVFDEMAAKVRDTLAGLIACSVHSTDPFREIARETLKLRSIHIVLHLEQPTFDSKLFRQVVDPKTARDMLRKKIRAVDPHAIVGSAQTINERVDWRVVFSPSS